MKPPKGLRYFHTGPWPFYFGFTMCEKAFQREMKRLGIDGATFLNSTHAHATTHTLTKDSGLTFIITLQKPSKKRSVEQIAALLAHEAVHVAQQVWEHFGEDRPGREAEAYLVQYVTQCCLQEALATGRTRSTHP